MIHSVAGMTPITQLPAWSGQGASSGQAASGTTAFGNALAAVTGGSPSASGGSASGTSGTPTGSAAALQPFSAQLHDVLLRMQGMAVPDMGQMAAASAASSAATAIGAAHHHHHRPGALAQEVANAQGALGASVNAAAGQAASQLSPLIQAMGAYAPVSVAAGTGVG